MEREKPAFDILGKIEQERLARGWSEYTLAENSGLTQSTISTAYAGLKVHPDRASWCIADGEMVHRHR